MKNIIFDTDLGGDCDDVLALDIILSAERARDCRLLGVTYCGVALAAPACIYAILKQHGRADVPIGRASESYFMPHETRTYGDCYASTVAQAFPDANAPTDETGTDAVFLLRKLLSTHEHITLIATGNLTNLAALLRSEGDAFSPLNGAELLRTHVDEIALMAAKFSHQTDRLKVSSDGFRVVGANACIPPQGECNIASDLAASRAFIPACPVPIVFCPFEVGADMITGKPMVEAGQGKTPDSLSYITHGSVNGRHSWDPATALYGIYGARPWFFCSAPGTVTVTEEAFTHFSTETGGTHFILTCARPKAEIAREMDRMVMRLYEEKNR